MKKRDDALLMEFRSKAICEWCGRPTAGCQPHHIFCKGMGGGGQLDIRENLLALDWLCHRHVQEKIPRRAQLEVVARREGKSVEEIEELIHRLRRT